MRRALLLALLLVSLSACNESMDQQNRYRTYSAAQPEWPGESEALAPPVGTVAQGEVAAQDAAAHPPRLTRALLDRGRERYDIFCSVCHGLAGDGDGIVVARGFPRPPPFTDARMMRADAAHLMDVIGRGYGVMYGFADRIEPADRWAIVAYIRALQYAATHREARQ